jgi:hypothetical protein
LKPAPLRNPPDPTGKERLCGEWQTDTFYSPTNYIRHFVNSRVL